MSFIKLDERDQESVEEIDDLEQEAIHFINELETFYGKNRWFSFGCTNIELGFMALRKGVTEIFKAKNASTTD